MKNRPLITQIAMAGLLILVLIGVDFARERPSAKKVLIGFKDGTGPQAVESRKTLIRGRGGRVRRSYRFLPAVAAELAESQISRLKADPRVAYVEEDGLVHALDAEIDSSWGVKRIGAGSVHASNKGAGVKVAIIDTGIDLDHPDLAVAGDVTFVDGTTTGGDDHGHGTHCAGIIAALDNDTGVVGVAPEALIYAVKVLNSDGSGYLSDVAAGIEWAIDNEMDIISMSLGTNYNYQTLSTVCEKANAAGIVVVAAAGNDYRRRLSRELNTVDYPARYDSVIAVGATDSADKKASWSSTGPALELAGPGVAVYSTYWDDTYDTRSGTSMACPHAAGMAALVLAGEPQLTNDAVRARLQETAEDLGGTGWDQWYGYGLVNAAAVGLGGEPPALAAIEVSPAAVTLDVADSQQFTATGKDQHGQTIDTGPIKWESNNTAVGTVSTNGVFTAKGAGTTTVTATGGGGVSGTATVTVQEGLVLTTIEVSPAAATLDVDDTQQFTATGRDQHGQIIDTGTIDWESSNTAVGAISTGGLFTAAGQGTATVTATGDGGVSGTATVTVQEGLVLTIIEVSPEDVTLDVGQTQQFTAAGRDQHGDPIDIGSITWQSSDEAVGTIDGEGLLAAIAGGTTTVTAISGAASGTANVTVNAEEPSTTTESFSFSGIVRSRVESRHKVSVSAPATMYVKLDWVGRYDLTLRIYDPSGEMVAEVDDSSSSKPYEEITIDVGPGDWEVAVKSDSRRRVAGYTIEGTITY